MNRPFISGIAALDTYLAEGFDKVPGMSSRFSATICGHLMRRQTEIGIRGSVAEIGAFEGRFLIAMGHALAAGEHAYGFDVFTWPDDRVSTASSPMPSATVSTAAASRRVPSIAAS